MQLKPKKKKLNVPRSALKFANTCLDSVEDIVYTGSEIAAGYPAAVSLVAGEVGSQWSLTFTNRSPTAVSAGDPYPAVEYIRTDVVVRMIRAAEHKGAR